MTFRGKLRPAVPVAPGPDGASMGIAMARCVACRALAIGELCADFRACCDRYRDGASPESYAAALRGELLAVAP